MRNPGDPDRSRLATESQAPRPRKGIYLLPNLLTTGCLFSGFYAIVAAIDKNFAPAGMAVFVAMLFDTLDGRIARLTHTESAFGKEYDSLADMVAFGVAPAIVAYQWGVVRIAEYGRAWGRFGWLAASSTRWRRRCAWRASMPARRRPTSATSRDCRAPRPRRSWRRSSGSRATGTSRASPGSSRRSSSPPSAGALMVSRFSYPSFKQFNLDRRIKFAYLLIVPLFFVLIAVDPADDAAVDVLHLRAVGAAAVGRAAPAARWCALRPWWS